MDNSKQFWADAFARQLHADFDGGVDTITENFKKALANTSDEKSLWISWAKHYANCDSEKAADRIERALREMANTTVDKNGTNRLQKAIDKAHKNIDKLSVEVDGKDVTAEMRAKAHTTLPAHVKERTMIEATASYKGKEIRGLQIEIVKNNNR